MNTQQHPLHQVLRSARNALAFVLLLLLWAPLARGDSTPFNRIFVFGDSLSDVGRMFSMSGGYPPEPYFNGRFCNGPLWIEYLSAKLGVTVRPEDNYAVGGATTGRANWMELFGGDFPGLQDELDWYESEHKPGDASQALFVVWAGANDVFRALVLQSAPESVIREGVANSMAALHRLKECGAHWILLGNLPDLGVLPLARNAGLEAQLTGFCLAYNAALGAALDKFTPPGVSVIRLDGFAVLQAMAFHPAEFGFSDVTDQLVLTGGSKAPYLFWDEAHPTTQAHQVLASFAEGTLLKACQVLPNEACRGLRGLLRAKGD